MSLFRGWVRCDARRTKEPDGGVAYSWKIIEKGRGDSAHTQRKWLDESHHRAELLDPIGQAVVCPFRRIYSNFQMDIVCLSLR